MRTISSVRPPRSKRPIESGSSANPKNAWDLVRRSTYDPRIRPALELGVARDVIAVRVRVGDHEFVAFSRMLLEPGPDQLVDGGPQREADRLGGGAAVHQQRPVVAEQQVEERRFVRDVLALP
jgi:hypothetical protein